MFNHKNGFVDKTCLILQLYTNVHDMTFHAVFLKFSTQQKSGHTHVEEKLYYCMYNCFVLYSLAQYNVDIFYSAYPSVYICKLQHLESIIGFTLGSQYILEIKK